MRFICSWFDGRSPTSTGRSGPIAASALKSILNATEAMSVVGWQPRALGITSRASPSERSWWPCDSGTGLDPRDGDRVFDAFFTTKAEGLGLGLSISRRIIEAHGGRLWATSNDGPGATVCFSPPSGSAHA